MPGTPFRHYTDRALQFEAKAQEIAWDLRFGSDPPMPYGDIAVRLGSLYKPSLIKIWCESAQPHQIEALPNSTVIGLFGRKGSGKSLAAAATAYNYYDEGIPVYYNPLGLLKFPPRDGGICEFVSLRDIIMRAEQLRNCLIVLDELQVNLSKWRTSTTASVLIRGVIQQVRKLGMDMVVTSNSPHSIDASFAEQLDFHAMCKAHLPPDEPQDVVDLHWCDTQGAFGKGPALTGGWSRRPDTRLRLWDRVWPASDMFAYYDHSVQVDPLEVMGLTANEIRGMQETKEIGLNARDLKLFVVNDLVPYYVKTLQATSLNPSMAVEVISQVFAKGYNHIDCCRGISTQETSEHGCSQGIMQPFVISPDMLGRALTLAGLVRRNGSSGYVLPDETQLPAFQRGAWSPGDE